MSIALVYDSTADLAGVEQRASWRMVPLTVHFGDEVYLDHVEMGTDEFFARLAAAPELPKTSQPPPGRFAEAYAALLADHDHVISLHISGKLSGTVESARLGAREFSDRVTVIDTRGVSLGIGLIVLAAQEMIDGGAAVADVLAYANRATLEGVCIFCLDTLEYLYRGGRIGRAQAFVGGLLNVHPLLAISSGEVVAAGRVRGKAKVRPALVDAITDRLPPGPVRLGVVHARAAGEASALADALGAIRADVRVELVTELGAVLGVYAGPGVIGAAFVPAP